MKDIFGRDKNISLALYNLLHKNYAGSDKDALAEIVLNRFNSSKNAIKRTYKERFNHFDDAALDQIRKAGFENWHLHDMAISDGRASLYFIRLVMSNFKDFTYHASDIAVSYTVYGATTHARSYAIADADNRIIEVTRPPFVWNYARPEGNFYFLNNFLKKKAGRKYDALLKSKALARQDEIVLLDADFIELTRGDQRFKAFNHNLFKPCAEAYQVIRVMNILHYGYFKEAELNSILDAIYSSLDINGLLVEGSNEYAGSPVEGAIYKKTATGFELLLTPEKPSRIANLVAAFRPENK